MTPSSVSAPPSIEIEGGVGAKPIDFSDPELRLFNQSAQRRAVRRGTRKRRAQATPTRGYALA